MPITDNAEQLRDAIRSTLEMFRSDRRSAPVEADTISSRYAEPTMAEIVRSVLAQFSSGDRI